MHRHKREFEDDVRLVPPYVCVSSKRKDRTTNVKSCPVFTFEKLVESECVLTDVTTAGEVGSMVLSVVAHKIFEQFFVK